MGESFLDYLDEQYDHERVVNKIQKDNEEYRYYEELTPLDFKTENTFICLKVKKTKIIFCQSNVKVYLSDADIIKNIVNFDDKSLVNFFLDGFVKLYKGENRIFNFRIKDKKFEGRGIEYIKGDCKFLLHTDNSISLNEFIFILNMIFEKDRVYSEVIGKDLLKVTLSKFISLINLYSYDIFHCREFLKKTGYPVDKNLDEVFTSAKNTERINNLFRDLDLFEKSNII